MYCVRTVGAASALRARLLRSYVLLRRVRTKVSSPAPYPDSSAAFFHSQFQIQTRRNEDRTLSADTRLYSVRLFERRCIFLFQKRKSDKQSSVVEKVLSLFLFVEFEIISGSADWEKNRKWRNTDDGMRLSDSSCGKFRRLEA